MTEIRFWPVMAAVAAAWCFVRLIAELRGRGRAAGAAAGRARGQDLHGKRSGSAPAAGILRREMPHVLVLICVCVIVRMTFFPAETADGAVQPLIFDPDRVLPLRVNLQPFVHMVLALRVPVYFRQNILGNAALFLPVGIVWPVAFPKLDRFWKVVLAGALFSFLIELAQLPFAVRATDIDDLILNTAGCAAGYGIFCLIRSAWKKAVRARSAR